MQSALLTTRHAALTSSTSGAAYQPAPGAITALGAHPPGMTCSLVFSSRKAMFSAQMVRILQRLSTASSIRTSSAVHHPAVHHHYGLVPQGGHGPSSRLRNMPRRNSF